MLDLFNFTAVADDNIQLNVHVAQKTKFVSERTENIMEKGDQSGNQYFFSISLFARIVKTQDCMVKDQHLTLSQILEF